jgi:three-Cys-motif partner protein
MAKKRKPFEQEECLPLDLPLSTPKGVTITLDPLRYPIWTENKAKLIERYLYLFVQVTHHGTYIDGFAGPQEIKNPELWDDMWAAKRVLEYGPKLMQHFYLFDKFRKPYKALEALKAAQSIPLDKKGRKIPREIVVRKGDFNLLIHELLADRPMRESEATFCLLDQRTFECEWTSVEALARYKKEGRKIELFYFLPIAWLGRAIANQKNVSVLEKWWGRDDWTTLRGMKMQERLDAFVDRFKNELGYLSVMSWPIFKRKNNETIMYYMIHATDHEDAPHLMYRAYHEAIKRKPLSEIQMSFADLIKEFGGDQKDE